MSYGDEYSAGLYANIPGVSVDNLGPVQGARPRVKASDILAAGAKTYAERNKVYGDNYLSFGPAMAAMFPEGLRISTPEEWARLGVFVQCASKLSRYATSFAVGGHADSAHDLMVYAAMLEEVTQGGA